MESPKKESQNFLDALPLMRSEDSDPLIVLNSEAKSKGKEKKSQVKEAKLMENKESKESFELLSQTVDDQVYNRESQKKIESREVGNPESIKNTNKNVPVVVENNGKSQCEVRPSQITELKPSPIKIEYRMNDSSFFFITINAPIEEENKEFQGIKEDSAKLFVEKDLFMAQDLKSYCPKIPKKSLPWTIFGAGIAAFIVFIIIIIKIRRGIKR